MSIVLHGSGKQHDLVWHDPRALLGLSWQGPSIGTATEFVPFTVITAKLRKQYLLNLNSNLLFVAEIRYRDADPGYLGGTNHTWWLRDRNGKLVKGWDEGSFLRLDFRQTALVSNIVQKARAVCAAGYDGVFLDWWEENEIFEGKSMTPYRTNLLASIRAAIGPRKLIIANANDHTVPLSAPWINGLYMECYNTTTPDKWKAIEQTLTWADANLRKPRVNCLEFWYHHDRNDLNLMRAASTLALTRSDGYCLFADPNPLPTPDHLHNWYPFWNRSLGRPTAPGALQADGTVARAFERGIAVFNTMGNTNVTLAFPAPMTSLATGITSNRHVLACADGDIFLTTP